MRTANSFFTENELAFTTNAEISQHPNATVQGNRTLGQEDTFTLTALQRITFGGFHVLRGYRRIKME